METTAASENHKEPVGEIQKKTNKRLWWVAGLLSFLESGLGQVYCGRLKRGILFSVISYILYFAVAYGILTVTRLPCSIFIIGLVCILIASLLVGLFIIVDAIIIANRYKDEYHPKPYNKWYVYVIVIVITQFVISPILKNFRNNVIHAYMMPSESMAPTILKGDFIFVEATAYRSKNPTQRDIIVFDAPERKQVYAKRVIGIAGDTIEIINKEVFINGKHIDESYTIHTDDRIISKSIIPRDNYGPTIIPEGHVFVLGDNRDNSLDSRVLGSIDIHLVKGKATKIYLSWNSAKWRVRWNRIGQGME